MGGGKEFKPTPSPAPGPRTAENLGGSPVFAHLSADGCPNGAVGYTLVTKGRAYYEADKQHYVTSSGGDVIFHADATHPAVLQSDHGVAEINAGDLTAVRANKNINVVASSWHAETPGYSERFKVPAHKNARLKAQKSFHTAVDIATYALELYALLGRPLEEPKKAEPGPHKSKRDWLAAAVAAINGVNTGWSPKGGTHFVSDGEFSATGGLVAGLYGLAAAEVMASLGALMLGGKSTINGFLYGLVFGGLEAGMNALNAAKILAKNKVELQSLRGTSVVAGEDVRMHGHELAQLDGGKAALSGARVFVGAASSFGLYGDKDTMMVGKVGNAKDLKSPGPDKNVRAGIVGEKIELRAASDVFLELTDSHCSMEAGGKQITLGATGITANTPRLDFDT